MLTYEDCEELLKQAKERSKRSMSLLDKKDFLFYEGVKKILEQHRTAQSVPTPEIKTNGDKLRSMSDDELAMWLCDHATSDWCFHSCPGHDLCVLGRNGLKKWIKQPAEEVTRD